jgi:predicted site-specific integrase-resolvase
MTTTRDRPSDELLDEAAAAARLAIAPATLRVWRCTGRYALPFVKVGRLVRYRASDIDRFIARRTHGEVAGLPERSAAATRVDGDGDGDA